MMFIKEVYYVLAIVLSIQGAAKAWGERYFSDENFDDEDITTQIAETTTTTEEPCLHKSSFVRKDLEVMVDYLYDHIKINDSLKNFYISRLKEIQARHMKELDDFYVWFKDQPEQLKHVIEDIGGRRHVLEEKIKRYGVYLKDREVIEKRMEMQANELQTQQKKLNNIKNICATNCGDVVKTRNYQSEYYCGTAEEIKNIFTHEIYEYVNSSLKPELDHEIESLDNEYEQEIQNLILNVKDIALRDYGHILVDILRLQNEYYHYDKLFNGDILYYNEELQDSLININSKLVHLKVVVEKYKMYCLQCASKMYPVRFSLAYIKQEESNTEDKPQNLLQSVIASKIQKVHKQVFDDVKHLLSELDEKIVEIKERDTNVQNLKPMQDEIKSDLDKERDAFNKIKAVTPEIEIKNFLSLKEKVDKINRDIQLTLDELNSLMPKL